MLHMYETFLGGCSGNWQQWLLWEWNLGQRRVHFHYSSFVAFELQPYTNVDV